jgi:hypothetical protein
VGLRGVQRRDGTSLSPRRASNFWAVYQKKRKKKEILSENWFILQHYIKYNSSPTFSQCPTENDDAEE